MRNNFFFLFFALVFSFPVFSAEPLPRTLVNVGVIENIGNPVDQSATFYRHDGTPVSFSSMFNGEKAVILNLAYYSCPMLCHLVANGLATGMKELPFPVGTKYDVVTISIDPNDTIETASAFRKRYLDELQQDSANTSWSFLYGSEEDIKRVANSVGFNYRFNDQTQEFAHSAAIIVMTPDGNISRYLYGIEFRKFDLKLAILGAIDKKLISTVDRALLFCYNYDPQSRKYVLFAQNLMRIGGLVTIGFILLLLYRLRKTYK